MPVSTATFVAICTGIRRALKVRATTNRINTGVKAIKKMEANQSMIGVANKELVKERKRMAKVLAQAAKIKKAKSIEMPKIFIDEYEKAVRFAVEKYGPDPRHKEVRKHFGALQAHLKELDKEYGGRNVALSQAMKALKEDRKAIDVLTTAWYDYSKAFLALSVAAGTNPAASSMTPGLWGNMQQCSAIGKQMSDLGGILIVGEKILQASLDEVSDRHYFINEHISHTQQKDYLATL